MTAAVKGYLAHLRAVETEDPTLLLVYAYHLHMAILAGGAIIKRMARRSMNLPQNLGAPPRQALGTCRSRSAQATFRLCCHGDRGARLMLAVTGSNQEPPFSSLTSVRECKPRGKPTSCISTASGKSAGKPSRVGYEARQEGMPVRPSRCACARPALSLPCSTDPNLRWLPRLIYGKTCAAAFRRSWRRASSYSN